jgi:hypothetical protein
MTLVQLTRTGAVRCGSAADFAAARAQFERRHALTLTQLIHPDLLALLRRRLAEEGFSHKLNKGIGTELRLPSGALSGGIEFLTNDPVLFDAIQDLTGCAEIGCYRGRVYRMLPGAGHASDWHSDMSGGRMITMSVNLSDEVFDGGDLQIRYSDTKEIVAHLRNTGFGDAVIFRIDARLEHQVLPLEGAVPRSAYAGWFLAEPDYEAMLAQQLGAPA